MPTQLKNLSTSREASISQTSVTLQNGATEYVVTDFSRGSNATHDGCDVVRRDPNKPAEVIFSYPYLSSAKEIDLPVGRETVQVTFIPKP